MIKDIANEQAGASHVTPESAGVRLAGSTEG